MNPREDHIKMGEEAVKERFIKHLETYPENMRYKVNAPNCLALMNWAYVYGRQTKEEEFNEKFIELKNSLIKYNEDEIHIDSIFNEIKEIFGRVLE